VAVGVASPGFRVVWVVGEVGERREWRLGRGRGLRCQFRRVEVMVWSSQGLLVGAYMTKMLLGLPRRLSLLRVYGFVSMCLRRMPKALAYLLTSSSSSCNVALFFSFCGFGFLTTGGGAVSSCANISIRSLSLQIDIHTLLNQSESSGLLAKSSMSSCCIARAAIIALAFFTSPEGFSGSARDPHHVRSCFIRRGSGRLCSMYL
jgi:hypothetical protein